MKIKGKRTYATVAAGLILQALNAFGIPVPPEVVNSVVLIALWFLRSGVNR